MLNSDLYRNAGHCTAELVITLFLAALIIAVPALNITELLRFNALKRDVRMLARDLEHFALAARQREAESIFSLYNNSYIAKTDSGESLLARNLRQNISINLATAGIPLTVTAYGTGTLTPRTIILSDGVNTCSVIVSLRGRVRWSC